MGVGRDTEVTNAMGEEGEMGIRERRQLRLDWIWGDMGHGARRTTV